MIRVDRKLNTRDVLDALADLSTLCGLPDYIRSYNGPDYIAQKLQDWNAAVGAKTAYITPGPTGKNGYCESFNACFLGELLNGKLVHTLRKAQFLIEKWHIRYNTIRPHSALGYRPPMPQSIVPMNHRPAMR